MRVPLLVCLCFFPGVFLHSRVTGACPLTTDLIMGVNVITTTTTTTTTTTHPVTRAIGEYHPQRAKMSFDELLISQQLECHFYHQIRSICVGRHVHALSAQALKLTEEPRHLAGIGHSPPRGRQRGGLQRRRPHAPVSALPQSQSRHVCLRRQVVVP